MKDSSIRCALWLKSEQIGIGDIVGICADIRTDNYIPFLATFYNGAIISPWHHETTLSKLCSNYIILIRRDCSKHVLFQRLRDIT